MAVANLSGKKLLEFHNKNKNFFTVSNFYMYIFIVMVFKFKDLSLR